MNIVFAADGSKFTKKALAFLVANRERLLSEHHGESSKLHVVHVRQPLPLRASSALRTGVVAQYHSEEAEIVLAPIRKFLALNAISATEQWVIGMPAQEIIEIANHEQAHLIVMGTHGHGALGRLVMGSVAQHVVSASKQPVLLVK